MKSGAMKNRLNSKTGGAAWGLALPQRYGRSAWIQRKLAADFDFLEKLIDD
jgi:hypothetical protein